MRILTHRIYDTHTSPVGHRVLVDRLWPRGITREAAHLDDWWKALTPSTELRRWFHQEPDRWHEFRDKYLLELADREPLARDLLLDVKGQLVLLYAARNETCNHAQVLQEFLQRLCDDNHNECTSPPCLGG
jgi:uncharacterized protein YeaO (DUF488 family)